MRSGTMQKQLSRQRVLMALYRLADEDGLFCWATNSEIAAEADLNIETARQRIHDLEWEGIITTFRNNRSNTCRRQTVLMDHPAAQETIRSLMNAGRWLGWHSADARGVHADGRPLTEAPGR